MGIRSYMMPDHLEGEILREGDRFRIGITWCSTQKSFFKVEDENESLSQKSILERYIIKGMENDFFKRAIGYCPIIDRDGEFHTKENDYESLTKLAKILMTVADYKLFRQAEETFNIYIKTQNSIL